MADVELTQDMLADAVALISEFGGTVTLTYAATGGAFDPAQGKKVGGTAAVVLAGVKAIIEDKGLWLGPETGVVGEKKLTVAASGLTKPKPGDSFTAQGQTFKVMEKGVKAYAIGDTDVIFELYGVRST